MDSPLAGKVRPSRLNADDANTSGDIGLFDVATEDEAVSTEYSSAEEDSTEQESQGFATNSDPAVDESDNSEWAPDTLGGIKGSNEHIELEDSSLELTAVKKGIRGSTMVRDPPSSSLQYKSSTRTPRADKLGIVEKRTSFDSILEQGSTDHANDSTIVIPDKKARMAALTHAGPEAKYIAQPVEIDDIPKKKKR